MAALRCLVLHQYPCAADSIFLSRISMNDLMKEGTAWPKSRRTPWKRKVFTIFSFYCFTTTRLIGGVLNREEEVKAIQPEYEWLPKNVPGINSLQPAPQIYN